MSKPTHTQEPWVASGSTIFVKRLTEMFSIGYAMHSVSRECRSTFDCSNAARIVECVNAMEGIENPVEFMNQAIDLLKLCKARFEVKESVLKSPTIITRIDDVLKKTKQLTSNQLISK